MALLRRNLTPFLKVVKKALSYELENGISSVTNAETKAGTNALMDEIIQNLPDENSTSNILASWTQASDTLHLEFDQLLNLR